MLELLKAVVELLGKILNPEMFKIISSDQRKRRKLGVALYLLYIDLNRVITEGEEFISFASDYLKSRDRNKSAGFPSRELQAFMRRQGVLLKDVQKTIDKFTDVLTIIDTKALREIRSNLMKKENIMRAQSEREDLKNNLQLGRLTLDIKTGEYIVLPQFRQGEPIPDSLAEKIQSHLQTATANLNDFKDCSERMRSSLEKHFTISDLLVPISEQQRDSLL